MFKRTEPGLSADDVVAMLAHAASSFELLASLNAAISRLSGKPKLARDLARAALVTQEMAEELADSFGEYKREYGAARERAPGNEQGVAGE